MQKIMKAKTRRGEKSIIAAFGRGLAFSVIAQLLLIAVAAAFTSGGIAAESIMHIMAAACAAISSFIGAFICALSAPKLALPLALGVGVVQLAVNFALGILLAGSMEIDPLMPAAFIVGAAAAGVLSAAKKGRK